MRRISAKYAKPGMVLGRPVYDNRGHMIYDSNTQLTDDSLGTFNAYGVGEILIEDIRVKDVVVQPLIPSELEGQAVQALRQLVLETYSSGTVEPMLLEEAKKPIYSMTRVLFPDVIGEPNVAGCSAIEGYNFLQPVKVAELALLLGRRLGLPMLELAPLGVAALLMNVGYTMLPNIMQQPSILDKPGPLSEDEFIEIKRHTECGANILKQSERFDSEVIDAVFQHHERWDGSGYPAGLKGQETSLFARIIAIADTYFAMVSKRPHRKAYLPHEAIEFIIAFGGDLFDPELVQLFYREVPLYPLGVTVKMNTGEVGIVIDANLGSIGRPVVRVVYDENSTTMQNPYEIDLRVAEHQQTLIVEALAY